MQSNIETNHIEFARFRYSILLHNTTFIMTFSPFCFLSPNQTIIVTRYCSTGDKKCLLFSIAFLGDILSQKGAKFSYLELA